MSADHHADLAKPAEASAEAISQIEAVVLAQIEASQTGDDKNDASNEEIRRERGGTVTISNFDSQISNGSSDGNYNTANFPPENRIVFLKKFGPKFKHSRRPEMRTSSKEVPPKKLSRTNEDVVIVEPHDLQADASSVATSRTSKSSIMMDVFDRIRALELQGNATGTGSDSVSKKPTFKRSESTVSKKSNSNKLRRQDSKISEKSVKTLKRQESKLSAESKDSKPSAQESENIVIEDTPVTPPKCTITFTKMVVLATFLVAFISCLIMAIVLEVFITNANNGPFVSYRDLALNVLATCSNLRCTSGYQASVRSSLNQLKKETDELVANTRVFSVASGFAVILICVAFGYFLGRVVSRPTHGISTLIGKIGDLNFNDEDLAKMRGGHGSRINDIRHLQDAVCRLAQMTETFARFVPETVVRGIVRGDEKAMRLHVKRKKVTIMFSDIADFTTVCEKLSQEEVLFMLTRYLSIMTRIVDSYQGVVAEILGDGLLVFWNTPDDVEQHAAKAISTALAQQRAMEKLNAEFEIMELPQLSIRIGLHTGKVLTGNLGSETKMKFGCMGDPINLASRLESLCKFYGVGILCSSATYNQLPAGSGFFCRQLDLVQVKGKNEPTRIYEVVGLIVEDEPASPGGNEKGRKFLTRKAMSFCVNVAMDDSAASIEKTFNKSTLNPFQKVWKWASWGQGEGGENHAANSNKAEETEQSASTGSYHASGASDSTHTLKTVTPEVRRHAQEYEAALAAYQQARFEDAYLLATTLVEEHPSDRAAMSLLERLSQYVDDRGNVTELPESQRRAWTGVQIMFDK